MLCVSNMLMILTLILILMVVLIVFVILILNHFQFQVPVSAFKSMFQWHVNIDSYYYFELTIFITLANLANLTDLTSLASQP